MNTLESRVSVDKHVLLKSMLTHAQHNLSLTL